jgi:hypothetical protein
VGMLTRLRSHQLLHLLSRSAIVNKYHSSLSKKFASQFFMLQSFMLQSSMKKITAVFLFLALAQFGATSGIAQNRVLGANSIILDDGLTPAHTVTITFPGPGAGPASNTTFALPNAASSTVPNGTAAGSTLRWNNVSNMWESSNAITNNGTGLTSGYSIHTTNGPNTGTVGGLFADNTPICWATLAPVFSPFPASFNVSSLQWSAGGTYVVTLNASYNNLCATATVTGATPGFVTSTVTSSSTIAFHTFNTSGVATDLPIAVTIFGRP